VSSRLDTRDLRNGVTALFSSSWLSWQHWYFSGVSVPVWLDHSIRGKRPADDFRCWASNMGIRNFFLIALVTLMACGPHEPSHSEFKTGMTRSEILSKFGKPQQTQTLTKTGEPIWGPIEDYWPRVPIGATVEIWSYDSHMIPEHDGDTSEQPGQSELYFVNDSNEVTGTGFHFAGAVYESS